MFHLYEKINRPSDKKARSNTCPGRTGTLVNDRLRSETEIYGRKLSCAVEYGRIRPLYAEHQKFVAQTAEND